MDSAYRDSAETLRARLDALELENVVLKAKLRRAEVNADRASWRRATRTLMTLLALVVLLMGAGALLGSCLSTMSHAAYGGPMN